MAQRYKRKLEEIVKQGMRLEFNPEGKEGDELVRRKLKDSNAAFNTGAAHVAAVGRPSALAATPADTSVTNPHAAGVASLVNAHENATDPQEKIRLQRLLKFQEAEEARAKRAEERRLISEASIEKRRRDAQLAKEARQASAKTPEGRAKAWLQGLQEHISKCDAELQVCKAKDCPLPAGLAREFVAQWSSKGMSFKRARTSIEGVLNGSREAKDFKKLS